MKIIDRKLLPHLLIVSVSFPMTFFKCVFNGKKAQESRGGENNERRGRFYEISSSDSWKRFKKAWREMDEIASFRLSDDNGLIQEFRFIDIREQSDSLTASLSSLEYLQEIGLLSSFEKELLADMAESKIKHMSGYIFLTRSMPALIDVKMSKKIKTINARINELEELKRENLVSDGQFDSALENIVCHLNDYARMQTAYDFLRNWGWDEKFGYDPDLEKEESIDVEREIQITMLKYGNMLDEGRITLAEYDSFQAKCRKTMTEIAVFDSISPFMDSLFRNLCTEE